MVISMTVESESGVWLVESVDFTGVGIGKTVPTLTPTFTRLEAKEDPHLNQERLKKN